MTSLSGARGSERQPMEANAPDCTSATAMPQCHINQTGSLDRRPPGPGETSLPRWDISASVSEALRCGPGSHSGGTPGRDGMGVP
jgi:hypothetical protein